MQADIASRTETTTQIITLVRFAVLATLALALLLVAVDVLAGGARAPDWRFLSERVLMTIICGIAAVVVVAIAAATCLALRRN
jgi:hypothetical protein